MEKKRKGIQVYAIMVCLIAIITFIISTIILVGSIIDQSDPINSGPGYSRDNLSSLENYKMQTMKAVKQDQAYIPDDAEIKKMYEAAKEERINKVLHKTKRNLIVTGILILMSIALFIIHWQIIKKYNKFEDSAPA